MKSLCWLVLASAFVLWCCPSSMAADEGEGVAKGVVEDKDTNKADDGVMTFVLTVRGEGIWHATFMVGPDNKDAYALVGSLRKGEHVTVTWYEKDDQLYIRKIDRDTKPN